MSDPFQPTFDDFGQEIQNDMNIEIPGNNPLSLLTQASSSYDWRNIVPSIRTVPSIPPVLERHQHTAYCHIHTHLK